jgi:hypothetical protein
VAGSETVMLLIQEAVSPSIAGIPWFYAVFYGGQTLLILIVLIYFAIKSMPTWERIRNRELDVRDSEAKVLGEIAAALCQVSASNSQMASSLNQTAETTRSIAVEQRRATEILEILESSNSQQQDRIGETMKELSVRLKVLEAKDDRLPAH